MPKPQSRAICSTGAAELSRARTFGFVHEVEALRSKGLIKGASLDNTVVLYGSPMGDSNVHNHKRVPIFIAGHAGGALKGNLHVKAADGTPLANAMLTVAHKLGLDVPSFGDSSGELDLNAAAAVATEKA